MKVSFKVEGLAALEESMSDLSKSLNRNILLRTLKAASQPIADAGAANAPKLSGRLSESYTVGTKLSRRQRSANKKESPVEVYVGPTPHVKTIQTEFGNAHQAAHPHLRPAWDSNVQRVLSTITGILAQEIEKARARIARKAARELAKLKT